MLAEKDHVHTTTLLHFPDPPAKISELAGEVAAQSRQRRPTLAGFSLTSGSPAGYAAGCNSCCFHQILTELGGNKGEMLGMPLPHLL